MSHSAAKIRLRIGQLEVEYEGCPSFLEEGLFNLLEKSIAFNAEHNGAIPTDPLAAPNGTSPVVIEKAGHSYTTNAIAARLNASSGSDLAVAASAKLCLVNGRDKFSRKEINNEMKSATTYYNSNMTGNLGKILVSLVKQKRLNEVAKDMYSVSATERRSLEARLAQ
jgi:hypothetical protein